MTLYRKQPEQSLQGKKNQLLIEQTNLPPGVKGNLLTVKKMREVAHERAAHPKIRRLALNILNHYNTPSHFFAKESLAIGDYVKNKVKYVKDATGIEQVHDPLTLIDQIERGICRADCDDMALLIACLLLSIGHKPKFRCVRYNGNKGSYNHIYVVDYAKDFKGPIKRICLDAIIKNKPIGFEVPHKSGDEYEI